MPLFLKIEESFLEDTVIEGLHDRTFRVHVNGLVYCARNLTDGYLTIKQTKVLAVMLGFPIKKHLAELVGESLWVPVTDATTTSDGTIVLDGYAIKNYLKYNPSSSEIKSLREERRIAGKKGAAVRQANRQLPEQELEQEPDQVPSTRVEQSRAEESNYLKAVTADQEIEHEIDKLLKHIKGSDDGTRGVLLSVGRKLPVGCIAKVRESCMSKTVSAGYAVNALKSELAELEDVA